jgi:hypothetical protein
MSNPVDVLRGVVPSREELERRIDQAQAVIAESDEYPREYVGDARREIARCTKLVMADAALAQVEALVAAAKNLDCCANMPDGEVYGRWEAFDAAVSPFMGIDDQ